MQIPGYRIIRKISQGGMSTVYLAEQENLKRLVALKVMAPALNADPIFSERFQREAKIVSQLNHPNIVAIHDIGRHKTINYIAMDYLEQGSVANKIRQGMTAKECLSIVQQVALALDHAHTMGYIHRDIKPENILLRGDGTAILSDFGVARAVSSATKMTNAGTVLGTPSYMSPEQARGKELDGRSDIYSLGIVLFEMLTGSPPYEGEEAVAIAIQHLTAPVPKLPPKYAQLQPLLDLMSAKKPQDRLQTAREVADAIGEVLEKLNSDGSGAELRTRKTKLAKHRPRFPAWFPWLNRNRNSHNALNKLRITEIQLAFDDEALTKKSSTKLVAALFLLILIGSSATAYWYWQSYEKLPTPVIANATIAPGTLSDNQDGSAANSAGNSEQNQPTTIDPAAQLTRYNLTVTTTPENAQIRIMNIKEKYLPGMALPNGKYLIQAQATGYFQAESWVTISDEPKTVSIELPPAKLPGEVIQHTLADGSPGPELVVLGPGVFVMGSLRYSDSQPRHEEEMPRPFAIAKTETTFAQFDAYRRAVGLPSSSDQDWGRDQRPVINISWDDAQGYVQWLAANTGQPYRLPTEVEWEYAASNGGNQEYPWPGTAESGREQANCRKGCRSAYVTLFGGKTAPVASYGASPQGLYDLGGNVAEWVSSCYSRSYQVTPPSEAECERVIRGGSFLDPIEELNVFRRDHQPPEFLDRHIGFRVILALPRYSEGTYTPEPTPLD
ncbi:bifunctional serine/threonine-protein kinase/formylglycine-generating enzyme family protein [Halioxenophilus sp. WMMB6]|uniref:bifunctional serine/threonine-protein kinase/formylglycine-generating enzyme family protein n=1 Tax=Halioxenophilus sp. WMMB6 TaxID=3073815 RepID=UPI00295EABE2|nr:bifunctional serine/threonine-protein kinase/formylglycine-generating enzyme family protein [Halioxenophilus sp. WMMB6]